MSEEVRALRRNFWAITSLTLGATGFALSLTTPLPFIPLISLLAWPLGLGALLAGWAGGRLAKAEGDPAAAAQARWGIRLGCLGWLIEGGTRLITFLIVAGLLAILFASFVQNGFNMQPTATP